MRTFDLCLSLWFLWCEIQKIGFIFNEFIDTISKISVLWNNTWLKITDYTANFHNFIQVTDLFSIRLQKWKVNFIYLGLVAVLSTPPLVQWSNYWGGRLHLESREDYATCLVVNQMLNAVFLELTSTLRFNLIGFKFP